MFDVPSRAVRACLILFVALLLLPAPARAERPFTQVFATNVPGNITIAANTLMSCPESPACTAARNAPITNTADNPAFINDSFPQAFVNTDPASGAPPNSSSAKPNTPTGATVLFAGLYWMGWTGGAAPPAAANQVRFKAPGGNYMTLSAGRPLDTILTSGNQLYQGFANVTPLVAAAGPGSYSVGGVTSVTGATSAAGWALVVAYRLPTEPARNLTIFDGLRDVAAGTTVDLDVAGFRTPAAGPVRTTLGFVAYEGDRGIVGDSASIANTTGGPVGAFQTLSDPTSPATNFFNSSTSRSLKSSMLNSKNGFSSILFGFSRSVKNL